MKVNMLTPMITENEKIVFMDFTNGKTYNLKLNLDSGDFGLEELNKDDSQSCFEDVKKLQQSLVPEIPVDEIREVLNTEKNLSKQNESHIFRRR